ncbi:MAG: HIT family protein [Actinomycetota bacterium]
MCIFCDIAQERTAAHIVLADEHHVAFLDHRPLFPGHCLLIPRQHHVTLGELPGGDVAPLFGTVQLLTRAVEDAVNAEGTFVALNNRVSQSVPHLHVHVVPRRHKDGLRGFFWPRRRYEDDAHMARVAADIRAALNGAERTEP